MTLFHGSPITGLKILKPFVSEHEEAYVYFSENPVVALLYAARPMEKPFSWYPYGFNKDGEVIYSEYYPGAFMDVYKNKSGCLYKYRNLHGKENPTTIKGVCVFKEPVVVDGAELIADLAEKFAEFENRGMFHVKKFNDIAKKERDFIESYLLSLMRKHDLPGHPEFSASRFLRIHFPWVWENGGGMGTVHSI